MNTLELNHAAIDNIKKELDSIDISKLSLDDLQRIGNILKTRKVVTQVENKIKQSDFNFQELKVKWLSGETLNTKLIYNRAMKLYFEFLDTAELHILDSNFETIDSFLLYIANHEKNYSHSTQRLYISAISSFFSRLVRWEKIKSNPFRGCKLPKKERQRALKVPTENDIKLLKATLEDYKTISGRGSHFKKASAEKLLIVIDLFLETGLRVGAIQTIEFGQDCKLFGISKGKKFTVIASKQLISRLKKLKLKLVTVNSIQDGIRRACIRSGITEFNCHSFRHYFAVKHYKENKDIYKLCKKLNHSGVSVTENYLKSLNEEV